MNIAEISIKKSVITWTVTVVMLVRGIFPMLNRILNRPLHELFIAGETDLKDLLLFAGDKLFFSLMKTLTADQASANAVYNFLIDLMGVQRAMEKFIIFLPEQKRKVWRERAEKYLYKKP